MPWARIDDGLHANEKFAAISLGATGLWTLCLSWTTDQLKDGFIPKAMVTRLGGCDALDLAQELVAAGLWEEAEGGYQVHDYLEYNPPSTKVIAEREAAKARMTRRRTEQKPNIDEGSPDVRPNFARSSPSPTPHSPLPVRGKAGSAVEKHGEAAAEPAKEPEKPELPRPRLMGKAAEVEQILQSADTNPLRKHWRAALEQRCNDAGGTIASKSPYALHVLKGWLAGDGAPEIPQPEPPPPSNAPPPWAGKKLLGPLQRARLLEQQEAQA